MQEREDKRDGKMSGLIVEVHIRNALNCRTCWLYAVLKSHTKKKTIMQQKWNVCGEKLKVLLWQLTVI